MEQVIRKTGYIVVRSSGECVKVHVCEFPGVNPPHDKWWIRRVQEEVDHDTDKYLASLENRLYLERSMAPNVKGENRMQHLMRSNMVYVPQDTKKQ